MTELDPDLEPAASASPASESAPPGRSPGPVPLPAGPGSGHGSPEAKTAGHFWLYPAILLAVLLSVFAVFRNDVRPVMPRAGERPAPVLPLPAARAPAPPPAAAAERPAEPLPPAPIPEVGMNLPDYRSSGDVGSRASGLRPASMGTLPILSLDEPAGSPRADLARYDAGETAGLDGGLRVDPSLRRQPAEKTMTAAELAACPACKVGAAAGKSSGLSRLATGRTFVQNEIVAEYLGPCEGMHVYRYRNKSPNKTITSTVQNISGETWTFTLEPGKTYELSSSIELTRDTAVSIRVGEVLN
ncbi:MAG TPA: hypothetical protein PK523_11300 [Elusimicrobiales bacterium]|nr:hypothetical protein [Elusimicrobiales bacterium]